MKKILVSGLAISGFIYAISALAGTIGSCVPVEVGAYSNRVHIKCSSDVGGVRYFAAPATDHDFASRVVAIGNAALVSGRSLMIEYDNTTGSGSSFGCSASNCKKLVGIGLR